MPLPCSPLQGASPSPPSRPWPSTAASARHALPRRVLAALARPHSSRSTFRLTRPRASRSVSDRTGARPPIHRRRPRPGQETMGQLTHKQYRSPPMRDANTATSRELIALTSPRTRTFAGLTPGRSVLRRSPLTVHDLDRRVRRLQRHAHEAHQKRWTARKATPRPRRRANSATRPGSLLVRMLWATHDALAPKRRRRRRR